MTKVISQRNDIFTLKKHPCTMFAVSGLVTPHYNNSSKHHLKLKEISLATLETHFLNKQYYNQLIPINTFINDKLDFNNETILVSNKILIPATLKLVIKRYQKFGARLFQSIRKRGQENPFCLYLN